MTAPDIAVGVAVHVVCFTCPPETDYFHIRRIRSWRYGCGECATQFAAHHQTENPDHDVQLIPAEAREDHP